MLPNVIKLSVRFNTSLLLRRGIGARSFSASNIFPSIKISANSISAQGSFAEVQAKFLQPDPENVSSLNTLVTQKNMGIVAHFYMDPELQGVLSALPWPHVNIADSLAMGDAATQMARNGVTSVACLGVDFMSENVRANLDANGFSHIPVYRLSEKKIGCTLAESAEGAHYAAFLEKASRTPNSLHVVYINTSLRTKGFAQSKIPTITCTSSNVVRTVLQAFAQVPDLTVWYGPDTYMGQNLKEMFTRIAAMPDSVVRALHPAHTAASVAAILPRFHFFQQGTCAVHHIFGAQVTETVRRHYSDAFHTAHLEVPGEMFQLALESRASGRGVVGSTSNILDFVRDKTAEAVAAQLALPKKQQGAKTLRFVLGTEAGMITSIVAHVQRALRSTSPNGNGIDVEIVFPVSSEAVNIEEGMAGQSPLGVVPGPAAGEGCSAAGGCATCPFMKMNSLDALLDLARALPDASATADASKNTKSTKEFLERLSPRQYADVLLGRPVTELGVVPIHHMRALMATGALSQELVGDIISRGKAGGFMAARS